MLRAPALIPLRSAGTVLCLHGITDAQWPGEGVVHLSLEQLRALIGLARRVGRVVPLRELLDRHQVGRSTAGLIAVTMDDAYASLLTVAGDFLDREAVPVTVFVVAQAAATGAAYWWDRVDDLFPRVSARRWRAFEDACGVPDSYRRGQPARYGPLRPLRQWILAAHAGRWPRALEGPLHALEDETGIRTRQRSLTWDELGSLLRLPAVEVGAHTLSHPVLPLLTDEELEREIGGAYRELRERCPAAVPVLSVPFGLFDRRTVAAAQACGMKASLTLAETTLRDHRSGDHIPRFCISRQDGAAKLRLRLAGLMDPVRWWPATRRSRYPALPSPTT